MNKSFVVHGCYHNRNFGDLLMADLISRRLESCFGQKMICPWMDKSVAENVSVKRGRGIRDFFTCKFAVFGGGGYLHGSDRVTERRLLRYSVPAQILQMRKVSYCIAGVGVGPEISSKAAARIRTICNGAEGVSVRDSKSRELLESVGVRAELIDETADLILGLTDADVPEQSRSRAVSLRSKLLADSNARRIFGLHLGTGGSASVHAAAILSAASEVLGGDAGILPVLIQDHGDHTETLEAMASEHFPKCVTLPTMTPWDLAATLQSLDGILTTKLHVGICSWRFGVPICGFSAHEKTRRFFGQINRHQFQADYNADPVVTKTWMSQFAKGDPEFFDLDLAAAKKLKASSDRNFQLIKTWYRE